MKASTIAGTAGAAVVAVFAVVVAALLAIVGTVTGGEGCGMPVASGTADVSPAVASGGSPSQSPPDPAWLPATSGEVSTFGGAGDDCPDNPGCALALGFPGETQVAPRDGWYVAMRWRLPYPSSGAGSVQWLRNRRIVISFNGRSVVGRVADWGPGMQSRAVDVGHAIQQTLGFETNDTVQIAWSPDVNAPLGPLGPLGAGIVPTLDPSRTCGITGTVASGDGMKAVEAAKKYLGVPYVYGGHSPSGMDCSGLMWLAYRDIGISIHDTTEGQLNDGVSVGTDLSQAQAGDFVIVASSGSPSGRHVGMFINSDPQQGPIWIEAPHTGDVVKIVPIGHRTILTIRRVLGATGPAPGGVV